MIINEPFFVFSILNRIPYYIPVVELYRVPQAKLPDINNAWVRYRNYGLECIDSRRYAGAVAAVMEINALFPDLYRVKIDSDKYADLMRENRILVCTACTEETNFQLIQTYDLILNATRAIISGRPSEKVWDCPKCKTTQRMIDTKMYKDQHEKPTYFQVIPEPPKRREGAIDRNSFHNEMVKWFYESLEELDHQLGKYRDEYKPQGDDEESIIEGDEDAD